MNALDEALRAPKYRQILEQMKGDILTGRYKAGEKLPSEAALVKKFATSRITVGRALRELRQLGLIERRAGSGSYVKMPPDEGGLLFGLLVPNLADTEIFGPICQGLSEAPQARKNALLWGNITPDWETKDEQAWELCKQYIAKPVAGVFFAPLERTTASAQTNHEILSALERARIPIVLLDRCVFPYPKRSAHDLVSIDHRRAGYMITEHLIALGSRRIGFVAYSRSASTMEARIAGYRDALFVSGLPVKADLIQHMDGDAPNELKPYLEKQEPDALVGGNDRTAGQVMQSLIRLNYKIPDDIRIVGIDDVGYASLLPTPLTTVHQPCREIGGAAVAVMLERLNTPGMPIRDILLDCRLVVRESCGAKKVGDSPQR
jgi:GntR family transcriptional regulator, arabinose operon transcriptional repressor